MKFMWSPNILQLTPCYIFLGTPMSYQKMIFYLCVPTLQELCDVLSIEDYTTFLSSAAASFSPSLSPLPLPPAPSLLLIRKKKRI